MSRKSRILLAGFVVIAVTLACGKGDTATTPTDDAAATQAAQADLRATESAALKLTEGAGTGATEAAQKTAMAASEATAQAREKTMVAGTAAVMAQITQQAAAMFQDIQKLYDLGIIHSTEGNYYVLPGFDEQWAQINWYQWYTTNYDVGNFVVKADMTYETASRTSNWFAAGCGFVFRLLDSDNNYAIFYTLDGNVYMWKFVDGKYSDVGKGYYGKPEIPGGSAQIMFAAEDDWFTFLVNGKQAFHKQDKSFKTGGLFYSLQSGTNLDFGQHCTFSNVEMWELP
jgi:hypothetical protein